MYTVLGGKPCSQRLRRRDRLCKLHEPRARLPVWPGGLSRRRLDGTLSVSYENQFPLGGGAQKRVPHKFTGGTPQLLLGSCLLDGDYLVREIRFADNTEVRLQLQSISSTGQSDEGWRSAPVAFSPRRVCLLA